MEFLYISQLILLAVVSAPVETAEGPLLVSAQSTREEIVIPPLRKERPGHEHEFRLAGSSLAELRLLGSGGAYHWESAASYGDEIERVIVKLDGDGELGGSFEGAESQLLLSYSPVENVALFAGGRGDFGGGAATAFGVAGMEVIAPGGVGFEGFYFLSDQGDSFGRFAAFHDLNFGGGFVLQSKAEFNLAAQSATADGTGSGFTDAELSFRFGYEAGENLFPYVGLVHARLLGDTADLARTAGGQTRDTRFLVGLGGSF